MADPVVFRSLRGKSRVFNSFAKTGNDVLNENRSFFLFLGGRFMHVVIWFLLVVILIRVWATFDEALSHQHHKIEAGKEFMRRNCNDATGMQFGEFLDVDMALKCDKANHIINDSAIKTALFYMADQWGGKWTIIGLFAIFAIYIYSSAPARIFETRHAKKTE